MTSLIYFSSEDFSVQRGVKGNILCHGTPGFCLVLFYSNSCVYCQSLIPIFKSLPGTIVGCQFGMVNVQANKPCIMMSKQTIAPIEYVPYIVLYINGKPYIIYKGPPDADEIRKFILEVSHNIQKKQTFSKEKVKESSSGQIPEYCIGHPVCTGGVCYLDFGQAYTS